MYNLFITYIIFTIVNKSYHRVNIVHVYIIYKIKIIYTIYIMHIKKTYIIKSLDIICMSYQKYFLNIEFGLELGSECKKKISTTFWSHAIIIPTYIHTRTSNEHKYEAEERQRETQLKGMGSAICDNLWKNPPHGIFFMKVEFDASMICSTIEITHVQVLD